MASLRRSLNETPVSLKAKARLALKALGNTPLTVARRLLALKCYGEPGSADMCPVAQYMKRKSFRLRQPVVHTRIGKFVFFTGSEFCAVPLPAAVITFAKQFDVDRYPSLIRRHK